MLYELLAHIVGKTTTQHNNTAGEADAALDSARLDDGLEYHAEGLFGVSYGAGLADDGNLNLTWVGHFVLDLLSDIR